MTESFDQVATPMECKHAEMHLGVLVLGVIDPMERPAVEAHVATCARCTATLAELAGLPGLLHQLDPAEAAAGLPPVSADFTARLLAAGRDTARTRNARRRVIRVGIGLVAAVVIVFAALFVPGLWRDSTSAGVTASTPIVVTGNDPATSVSAKVELASQATGTQLTLTLNGVEPGEHCQLVAVDSSGRREVAATWVASYQGRATVTGTTSLTAQSITSLEVVRLDGSPLVTMKVPPSSTS